MFCFFFTFLCFCIVHYKPQAPNTDIMVNLIAVFGTGGTTNAHKFCFEAVSASIYV